MWNIKVVQFANGKYGIRRGWFFHEYRDFVHAFWWPLDSKYIHDCMSEDYAGVLLMTQKPKVVHG
jgi:hypothetical protein